VSGEDGFLARWARRKEQAKAGVDPDAPQPARTDPAASAERALDTEELARRIATLPKIEDIGPATDIRMFLESWVPSVLRQQALRHVWMTDPKISTFIETADYQWDFTVPGGAPGCGPLEPDFDATDFLKRLFNEHETGLSQDCDKTPLRNSDSKGGDHVATHNDTDHNESLTHLDQFGTRTYIKDKAEDAPVTANAALHSDGRDEHNSNVASHFVSSPARRRHGGALPT
jgi:hypothetical protein